MSNRGKYSNAQSQTDRVSSKKILNMFGRVDSSPKMLSTRKSGERQVEAHGTSFPSIETVAPRSADSCNRHMVAQTDRLRE